VHLQLWDISTVGKGEEVNIATGSKRFMVYFQLLSGKLPEGAEENKNFSDFLR
jgi:hypothetical protein